MEREELHHSGLDVLTPWTFKGPQIVSRLLWFNARQVQLRRALRAIRTRVKWRAIGKNKDTGIDPAKVAE